MINASREFSEKLNRGGAVVNYADITLSNGTVLHLEPKDFTIGGCSIEDKTTDGKFGVGFVIGKTLSIRIANHDERFSVYDFYKSIINLYVAMVVDGGKIEKIRKGIYYTLVPETPGDIIEISAVDGMYKLDNDYSTSTTHYPATLQTIISDICLDCGIPIGFRQFDNMSFVAQDKPENTTFRQVLSWAVQIAGYNARIDNDGHLQLIWYNTRLLDEYNNYDGGNFSLYPHDTVIDGGNFTNYGAGERIDGGLFTDEMPEHIYLIKNLKVSTDDVLITGVRVIGEEDVSKLFGEEGYVIEIKDNQFAYGKESEIADYLGARIVGIVFRPFSADILNNPLYESFDIVRVSDRKGNVYVSLLNSVSYKIGADTQIACEAEDPVRNGSTYFSEAAAAVVEARRNSKNQITEYDMAVQNMNQIAMNAMGFHTTYEDQPDGSRIVYLHDKPLLEDSKIIYKQTIDGFFISTDGGQSYTAGFDKNGNVVVNVLYAIGIVADWIRTGRFTVHKGNQLTFLADADTGEVRIIADSFSLSSGKTIESIAEDKSNSALDIAKEFTKGEIQTYSAQVDSSLTLANDRISAEVTRATEAEGTLDGNIKTVNENLSSKIDQTAEEITLSISSTYETKDSATSQYNSFESRLSVAEDSISSKVSAGEVTSLIEQNADSIRLKASQISWSSTYSSMTDNGQLTCTSANIAGEFKTEERAYHATLGNITKKTEIKLGSINGYFNEVQTGLLDLSAIYTDSKKHAALKGFNILHLQCGERIDFEHPYGTGGYMNSAGWYFAIGANFGGGVTTTSVSSGNDLALKIPAGKEIKFMVGGVQVGHFNRDGLYVNGKKIE